LQNPFRVRLFCSAQTRGSPPGAGYPGLLRNAFSVQKNGIRSRTRNLRVHSGQWFCVRSRSGFSHVWAGQGGPPESIWRLAADHVPRTQSAPAIATSEGGNSGGFARNFGRKSMLGMRNGALFAGAARGFSSICNLETFFDIGIVKTVNVWFNGGRGCQWSTLAYGIGVYTSSIPDQVFCCIEHFSPEWGEIR